MIDSYDICERGAATEHGKLMRKKPRETSKSILWRKVHTPQRSAVDVEELEDRLWMYAEQLLSEEEESHVAELIACHPEVENRVEQIRATIDSASKPSWLVKIACAKAAAKRLTEAVGMTISEITGSIVKTERGLAALFPSPELLIAQPVMLGDAHGVSQTAPALGKRVDLPEKEGLRVSVTHAPGGVVNLTIRALNPPDQGEVQVTATVEVKGQPEKITAWMRGGRADIEDCPIGLLRIEAPGNRILHLLLQDLEEQAPGEVESEDG